MKSGWSIWTLTVGSEIRKTRPALLVGDDRLGKLPLKIIVPLTDWKPAYAQAAWMVQVLPDAANGLLKESAADAFQVRSVAQERLVRQLGRVGPELMRQVRGALAVVLSIKPGG